MELNLESLTRQVCAVAREVGCWQKQERMRFDEGRVEQKHSHDYVSYVDKNSENLIVSRLRQLLPEAGFMTEEGSVTLHDEEMWWVIDPLDGTTNYVHGNAPYAVSIALRNADEVLLGVVYEAVAEECFYAWKGGGSYLNDKPIKTNSAHDINASLVGIELPYDANAYSKFARKMIEHFFGRCSAIRMNGSAAMAICYIACGRWDGWMEKYIKPWDYMAGTIILREAGGKVTNYSGSEQCLNGISIIASNGTIHDELYRAISQHRELLPAADND